MKQRTKTDYQQVPLTPEVLGMINSHVDRDRADISWLCDQHRRKVGLHRGLLAVCTIAITFVAVDKGVAKPATQDLVSNDNVTIEYVNDIMSELFTEA